MPLQFSNIRSFYFNNKGFVVFSIVLFFLIYILENINHRFWLNDYKVYYEAAKALREGRQVYGIPFGLETGYYKYSPLIAMLFIPFSLLPYYLASSIHYLVIAIVSISVILLSMKMINTYVFKTVPNKSNILMILSLLAIMRHLFRELHLGNLNMIIVFILSLGLLYSFRSKYLYSGICMGLAIMIKPYFLLLIIPFILYKQFRTVWYTGVTLAVSFLIPMIFFGFKDGLGLHQEWFAAMQAHSTYLNSSETIQSIIQYYFYAGLPDIFQLLIIGMVVILYFWYFIFTKSKDIENTDNEYVDSKYMFVGFFCLLAIIPNILITDTEHFLFALPLIVLLIHHLSFTKNYLEIGLFALLILLPSCNTPDLLGHDLANKFDKMGMLGLTNLGIIAFAVYVSLRFKLKANLS